MSSRVRRLAFATLAAIALSACVRNERRLVAEFPTAARDSEALLGVIVTGDDGLSTRVRVMAERLARAGIPSVAVSASSRGASPAQASNAAAAVMREHLARWSRTELVLIGEDRGAGIAAFVANRIPEDLRANTRAVVLVGLEPRVSFAPSWRERFFRRPLATDLPVLPELERLRGIPILCLYDPRRRDDQLCPSLDAQLATHQPSSPSASDGSGDTSGGDSAQGVALAQRILGFVR